MTCWNGHLPHMNDDQIDQAVHTYLHAWDAQFEARWAQQPWAPPLEPRSARPPKSQSPTSLAEARAGDKVNAIDVEYVRVR